MNLDEIERLVPPGVLMLEYHLTAETLVLFGITRKTIRTWTVDIPRERVMELVRSFRRSIQEFSDIDAKARELYDILVAPAEAMVNNAETICIVPHGLLHYLPFSALVGPKGYLGDLVPMFYLPSSSTLRYLSSKNRTATGEESILAVGDPDLGDPSLDLPFAEKEVRAISESFDGVEVLLRGRATEKAVKSGSPGRRILHLACHGEFHPQTPLFSRLLLAAGDGEDGSLTVNEVFDLELDADLVSLSACRTGLEALRGGDELVGLNRAFMFAGARSVLASLWRVSDVATAVMVKRFYRYMSRGYDKVEALKMAQSVVKRYYPHPAYWAAFRIVGAPD